MLLHQDHTVAIHLIKPVPFGPTRQKRAFVLGVMLFKEVKIQPGHEIKLTELAEQAFKLDFFDKIKDKMLM